MNEDKTKAEECGNLYLCSVPIGNWGDISERCIQILNFVDCIAAEHPDKSRMFLRRFSIGEKPVLPYSGREREAQGQKIIELLQDGYNVALITDAGTPAVADPGEGIVRLCAEEGIPVRAVPGACALVCALAVSGLRTGRFCFEGFLSMNRKQRKKHLESLKDETRTMIFYEAPQKLSFTLKDLFEALGDRRITLCADLTKEGEEILYTTLQEASNNPKFISSRREYVLVVEGLPNNV